MFSLTKIVATAASKTPQILGARAIASSSKSMSVGAPNPKMKQHIETTSAASSNNKKVDTQHMPPKNVTSATGEQQTSDSKPVSSIYGDYRKLRVSSPAPRVLHIQLNRPQRRNAMNRALLHELAAVFRVIHEDRTCRAVILSGTAPHFCSGIDHTDIRTIMREITSIEDSGSLSRDVARRAKFVRNVLAKYQDTFSQVEKCAKPVVAVVDGACLGAALSLICCADVRIATEKAYFQLHDVAAGMMSDMGALQRMPKAVASESWIRELALSARPATAQEALQHGLVSHLAPDADQALAHAVSLASAIASKSPVAVQGTKLCLNYSRDHSIDDGLTWALNWNMGMLQSDDLLRAMESVERKEYKDAEFDDM